METRYKFSFAAGIILFCLAVDMVTWQLIITVLYLRAMKAYQYFEYYRHRTSVLAMAAISFLCIGNTVVQTAYFTQFAGCQLTEYQNGIEMKQENLAQKSVYCDWLSKWARE